MSLTQQSLTIIGVSLAAVVAIMLALLTQAKKFLDSDGDYAGKVTDVETKNISAARVQLQWINKDLTDPKSVYALHTYNSEKFIYEKTREVVHCFDRVHKCRLGIKFARLSCEFTKWASLVTVVLAVVVGAALFWSWPEPVLRYLIIAGGISASTAVITFGIGEVCLQTIRRQYNKSKNIDATLLP